MDTTTNEQKIIFARNAENIAVISDLFMESKSKITELIGQSEWETVVRAITLEAENKLVERFMVKLAELKIGKS